MRVSTIRQGGYLQREICDKEKVSREIILRVIFTFSGRSLIASLVYIYFWEEADLGRVGLA